MKFKKKRQKHLVDKKKVRTFATHLRNQCN